MGICLQAFLHPQGLSVVSNVDNVLPGSLLVLISLTMTSEMDTVVRPRKDDIEGCRRWREGLPAEEKDYTWAVFPRFGFAYLISDGHRKPPS